MFLVFLKILSIKKLKTLFKIIVKYIFSLF